MRVTVRLFAILRERAGSDHVELELPRSATVADAIAAAAALPGLDALAGGGVRMAVNREYAADDAPISPGDELALIPPVSGGDPAGDDLLRSGETVRVGIRAGELDADGLLAFVADPRAGATVSFQGLPRDIPVLDYEAYPEMALERMTAILEEVVAAHGLCRAAAEHRIGSVPAFAASIVIAVSAPHRGEAFSGAREALDRIKAEAPIWKVEVDEDGGRTRVEGVLPR